MAVSDLLGGLVRLLGQEDSLDVGQDSTLGDGDSGKQLVQLLAVPDGELEMTMILVFLLSQEALPANSRTSTARHSTTAAR